MFNMKELIKNLAKKMKVENFKTEYGVTVIDESRRSTTVHTKAFTSMGAVKQVKELHNNSLLVRVELAN